MLGKSKEIFEIGGPRILEECFTVSERSRAISETGVTDHSQNGNRILKRDCRRHPLQEIRLVSKITCQEIKRY